MSTITKGIWFGKDIYEFCTDWVLNHATTQGIKEAFKEYETQRSNQTNQIDTKQDISGNKVTSPIIGTAYLAPEPGGKKFVEVGKKVKKGDTIMIVEAMKTMNHVPSTFDGIVKEICVSDGQPVEFGQTLIIIE